MTKIASAKPKAIASAVGLGLTLATLTANKAYADPVDFETECVNPDKGCISPPDEYAKNGQQLEVRWQGAKGADVDHYTIGWWDTPAGVRPQEQTMPTHRPLVNIANQGGYGSFVIEDVQPATRYTVVVTECDRVTGPANGCHPLPTAAFTTR